MQAIQIQSRGGLEVLRATTLPDPHPGADRCSYAIKASAVNAADGIVRISHFLIAKKPPLILGEEATGIVSRMGLGSKDVGVIVHRGGLAVFAMGWDMGGNGGPLRRGDGRTAFRSRRGGANQCRRDGLRRALNGRIESRR